MGDINILKLAEQAKASISDYCISECKAKCCRSDPMPEFDENSPLKGGFCLALKIEGDKYLCDIHDGPERLKICREYPLHIDSDRKLISAAASCTAVEQGLFNSFFEQFREMGCQVRINSLG